MTSTTPSASHLVSEAVGFFRGRTLGELQEFHKIGNQYVRMTVGAMPVVVDADEFGVPETDELVPAGMAEPEEPEAAEPAAPEPEEPAAVPAVPPPITAEKVVAVEEAVKKAATALGEATSVVAEAVPAIVREQVAAAVHQADAELSTVVKQLCGDVVDIFMPESAPVTAALVDRLNIASLQLRLINATQRNKFDENPGELLGWFTDYMKVLEQREAAEAAASEEKTA